MTAAEQHPSATARHPTLEPQSCDDTLGDDGKSAERQDGWLQSDITGKLAADLGVDERTVQRRHKYAHVSHRQSAR
jgi:hypothetical protein